MTYDWMSDDDERAAFPDKPTGTIAREAIETILTDAGFFDAGVVQQHGRVYGKSQSEIQGQHPNAVWMDEAMSLLNGASASSNPLMHSVQAVPAPEVVTLLGRKLYVDDSGSTPDGDFALIGHLYARPDGTTLRKVDGWKCSRATYVALREQNPDHTARAMNRLKIAEIRGGETVVQGVVRVDARRPAAAQKPNRGNIADLRERSQRLVVQIATMSDSGPIPDGQVAELSKSYAALQAELDEALDEVDAAKENLSIIRAVMIEHSDPRRA